MNDLQFQHYTHISNLWNELGIRTRDPITKEPGYFKVAFQPRTFTRVSKVNASGNWKTLHGEYLSIKQHESLDAYRRYVSEAEKTGKELFGVVSPINQFIAENIQEGAGLDFNKLRTVFIDIEVESGNGFASTEDPYQPITAITVSVWGKYLVWGTGDYTPTNSNITYAKCDSEEELVRSFVKWWTSDYPDIITGWNVQFYDIPYIIGRIDKLKLGFKSSVLSPWGKTSKRSVMFNKKAEFVTELQGISILDYLELYRKFSLTQQASYQLNHIAETELGANKVSYSEYGSLSGLAKANYQKFIEYNVRDVELVQQLNEKLHHLDLCVQIAYGSRVNFTDVFKQVRMWDAIIYYDLHSRHIAVPTKRSHEKLLDYSGAYVKDPQLGKHSWVVSFDINSLYPSIMREWNISDDRHLSTEWLQQRLFEIRRIPSANNQVTNSDPQPLNWIDSCSEADAPYVRLALEQLLDAVNSASIDNILVDLQKDDPYPFLRVLQVAITPNNQVYRSDSTGFLPAILAKLYAERKEAKTKETIAKKKLETATNKVEKEKLKNEASKWGLEQNTKKILLNSCYGAYGNEFFRFFDIRHAEAITMTGQMIIRIVADRVNEFLQSQFGERDYVLASDTDSILITIDSVVKNNPGAVGELVDAINDYCSREIQPIIDNAFNDIHIKLNTNESVLAMKREVIAEHGVWTAKKRYILWVHDNEGVRYATPKMKIVGIESVRSSTPKYSRQIIKEALECFVKGDRNAFYELLENAESEFEVRPFEEIASPRSVNGLEDYPILPSGQFSPKTPIQVKGALVYNKHIKESGLENKYELIKPGQKIRFCWLKPQNPLRCNVIAAPNNLPTEWKLEKYLDRAEQFDKTVLQPLQNIIQYSGWTVRQSSSLDF